MAKSATLRLFALLTLILTVGACASATQSEKQALVERAQASAERFSADPNMSWFRENLKDAVPRESEGRGRRSDHSDRGQGWLRHRRVGRQRRNAGAK
jgi:hypothetical protein